MDEKNNSVTDYKKASFSPEEAYKKLDNDFMQKLKNKSEKPAPKSTEIKEKIPKNTTPDSVGSDNKIKAQKIGNFAKAENIKPADGAAFYREVEDYIISEKDKLRKKRKIKKTITVILIILFVAAAAVAALSYFKILKIF